MRNQTNYIDSISETIMVRPRERALEHGLSAITDQELLQLILGSGTKQLPVSQLASVVLDRLDRDPGLNRPNTLDGIPGLGPWKKLQLSAALELSRRLFVTDRPRIRNPADAMPHLTRWVGRNQEYFLCLVLNGANELCSCQVISVGLLNRTLVHPREIFAKAIEARAAAIIVAHNHPSGNLEASPEDIEITNRLRQAGEILGIPLIDHLIVSHKGYLSFAEADLL